MPTQKNDALRREIDAAAGGTRKGGLILYPTDTVWGIGCDATNEEAVARIYALKRSQNKKSMLVLCASADMTVRYVDRAPRHRLRGAGDGHLAADADPAGRRGRGRKSYSRRGNARRAYSRPRIPARGCCAVSAGRSSRPRPTSWASRRPNGCRRSPARSSTEWTTWSTPVSKGGRPESPVRSSPSPKTEV